MTHSWHVEIEDDKIVLDSGPWNGHDLPYLRAIPAGRYRKVDQCRTYPIDWIVCKEIRAAADACGRELTIGPLLTEWAFGERARQESIPDVQSMNAVPLEGVRERAPHLYAALSSRGFQSVGAKFMAETGTALIADHPGLGKTAQVLGAVVERNLTGPILVVAPRSAAGVTWPSEIRKWLWAEKFGIIGAHLTREERSQAIQYVRQWCRDNPDERFWVFTGPNYLRIRPHLDSHGNYKYDGKNKVIEVVRETVPDIFTMEWAGVIVDEAHKYLSGATANKKKQSAQRLGLGAVQVRKDGMRIAMSGTPFRGKPENLWGTLNWLRPDLWRSYWGWVNKHFRIEIEEQYIAGGHGETVERQRVTNEIIDEDAFYKELSSTMLRRTKAEVVDELPPKQYAGEHLDPKDPDSPVAIWLDPSKEQARAVRQLVKDGAAQLSGGTLMVTGVLPLITRMRQFADSNGHMMGERFVPIVPSNKIDWIVDWLDDHGIGGADPEKNGKVIIASQFTSFLELLGDSLTGANIEYHMLTGKTKDADRIRQQIEFQSESGPRVFLLNTESGGVSLTLDAADDVILCDVMGSPDDQEQVEDRAHRISRNHSVTIWQLATKGSIEEAMAVKQVGTEKTLKSLIDGTRGVEFAKQLVEYMKEQQ